MSEMTKAERLRAVIAGDRPDRPPVAFWRHFPGDDQDAVELAQSTAAFQRQFDFDFVKVTPASSYCVRDWGAEDRWTGSEEGTRNYVHYPVVDPDDWYALLTLEPESGMLGQQLRCLELLGQLLNGEVPVVQTVFNPLAQAKNLAGSERLFVHMRERPEAVRAGLETITQTTVRFVEAACRRGIDGIFFAVQHASYALMSLSEYQEFGVPYDRRVLEAADGCWLNVLHLHGSHVMFDLLASYPAQVVNWHDRETAPDLVSGRDLVRGAVLGGLSRWETLTRGTPEDVRREARDAMQVTDRLRFMLGTGCVTPITAPWANLRAARDVVDRG